MTYHARRHFLSPSSTDVVALREVDLELPAGKTLAVVGPSGSGKSTLARCIAGLEQPTSGAISFAGINLLSPDVAHRHVQLVFQDPGASLNPRFTVLAALNEPFVACGLAPERNPARLLEQVGLSSAFCERRTSQLSGGQKARLAIARALAALQLGGGPGLLILDESLGGLDLSVRAQIINLLVDLQEQQGLTYILITHDTALAAHLAEKIVVMAGGEIVRSEAT